jgi:hypothetical protein
LGGGLYALAKALRDVGSHSQGQALSSHHGAFMSPPPLGASVMFGDTQAAGRGYGAPHMVGNGNNIGLVFAPPNFGWAPLPGVATQSSNQPQAGPSAFETAITTAMRDAGGTGSHDDEAHLVGVFKRLLAGAEKLGVDSGSDAPAAANVVKESNFEEMLEKSNAFAELRGEMTDIKDGLQKVLDDAKESTASILEAIRALKVSDTPG